MVRITAIDRKLAEFEKLIKLRVERQPSPVDLEEDYDSGPPAPYSVKYGPQAVPDDPSTQPWITGNKRRRVNLVSKE